MSRPTGFPPALSGRALALLYVVAVALPLALAAFGGVPPADAWAEAATGAGIAGGVMLLLQLVSSGRFRVLSGDIGIDVTMGFHRWAAPLALVLVVGHVLLLLAPIDPANPGRALRQLWMMLQAPGLRDGVIALALALAMVPLALLRNRLRLPYEVWRATHALMALAMVWFSVRHILDRGTYAEDMPSRVFWLALTAGVVLPMVAVYLRQGWNLWRFGWRVAAVRPRAERLWEVVLESTRGRALGFRAGQFGWLAALSRRWPMWFDHPFSIASAPGPEPRLRLLIAEAGDFTNRIGTLETGRLVGLDAPHGNFHTDHMAGAQALVLVAGGVGIAPMLGILEDLAARGETRPVRLVYGARNPAAFLDNDLLAPPLESLGARAILIADDPQGAADLLQGPIRAEHLRDALDGLDPATTAALICGPGGMTTAVADALNDLGLPLSRIHYERFDYSEKAGARKDRVILNRFRLLGTAAVLAALAFALR